MRFPKRLLILAVTLLLVTATTAACGIANRLFGGGQLGSESDLPADTTVYPVCNNRCAATAQCGVSEDEQATPHVFFSIGEPATRNHVLAIPTGTPLLVREVRTVRMVREVNNAPEEGRYYRVDTGQGFEAWAAGWCLSTVP